MKNNHEEHRLLCRVVQCRQAPLNSYPYPSAIEREIHYAPDFSQPELVEKVLYDLGLCEVGIAKALGPVGGGLNRSIAGLEFLRAGDEIAGPIS